MTPRSVTWMKIWGVYPTYSPSLKAIPSLTGQGPCPGAPLCGQLGIPPTSGNGPFPPSGNSPLPTFHGYCEATVPTTPV